MKLIKTKTNLPSTLPELQKFILIGQEQLKVYQAKVRAIEKLGMAKAVKDQAVEDGQRMGSALLYAEAKMGELLKGLANPTSSRQGTRQLPEGINKKQSHFAQKLADNKDLIEETIADAKEYEDIPTKRAVFKKIEERDRLKERSNIKNIELPVNKFDIIYADPPWQFSNSGMAESAESQYPTMSTDKICEMNIKNLKTKNSVLFLWATNAMLEDALLVCRAWGFNYKSNIVWIKSKGPSIGWFVQSRHELLLICTAENNTHPEHKPISWVEAETTKHSKKPEIFYEIIEKMYPGMKRLELFARTKKEGWESFGNQISKS